MKRLAPHLTLLAFGALLLGVGCDKPETGRSKRQVLAGQVKAAEPAAPSGPAAEARHVYKTKCSLCHGNEGAADGPAAAVMNPKPRSFKDATWQAKATDDQIKKAVLEGGPAVGLSVSMPPNPELKGREEVLTELVTLIRALER